MYTDTVCTNGLAESRQTCDGLDDITRHPFLATMYAGALYGLVVCGLRFFLSFSALFSPRLAFFF
jgi:hypothetical protein